MRAPKHSDFNALKHVNKAGRGTLTCNRPSFGSPRLTEAGSTPPSALSESSPCRDAVLTLTVHNRVPWIHSQLTRFSQHVVLSSQTLADFVRAIPCDSSEMPNEVIDSHGNVVGYTYESEEQDEGTAPRAEEGCLLLIEGVVYGDGRPGDNYAEYVRSLSMGDGPSDSQRGHSKLLSHLERLPDEKRLQITKSPTSLSQSPFASLTLRINQPYWMLHQGNCEHFVVIDQIRCVSFLRIAVAWFVTRPPGWLTPLIHLLVTPSRCMLRPPLAMSAKLAPKFPQC